MKALAEFAVSGLEVLEAEGRTLRQEAFRLLAAGGLVLIAAGMALGGVALVSWSLYIALQRQLDSSGAAFIVGGIALAIAGGLAWTARNLSR